ncbi:MAG: HigA family addiction module antitoxin [Pseudomonadota bacterium]
MTMKSPPHPGRIVKSSLDEYGLSVAQAAGALGVSRSQLNRVLNGTSSLSAELALRLEVVVGSKAETWLRLQAAYDAADVRRRSDEITSGLQRLEAPKDHQVQA